MSASPINPTRLENLASRLYTQLEEDGPLAYPSLQYQLCEVGPLGKRWDPRELQLALRLLTGSLHSSIPPAEPLRQPLPGIFAAATGRPGHCEHKAELAAATKQDQLRDFATRNPGNRALLVAEQIADALSLSRTPVGLEPNATEALGGDARWSAATAKISVETGGPETAVWVIDNIGWLFPDNPNLWRQLASCDEAEGRCIIVARKIAVATFPLLKRLGAIGVQLHHLYLPKQATGIGSRALEAGPLMQKPPEVQQHIAVTKWIRRAVTATPDPPALHAQVRNAISLAKDLGLDRDDLPHRSKILRQWGDKTAFPMPRPWKAQLTRYARWATMDA